MKKLIYLAYYSDSAASSNRKAAPSADTKIDYIIESIKKSGIEVEVISFCADDDRKGIFGKKSGYEIKKNGTRVIFLDNYTSKYRPLRVFGRWMGWHKTKRFLREKCINEECEILIYHSLGFFKVINFLSKKKKGFLLEVEEIYADVIGKPGLRQKEIAATQQADGFIFPTRFLSMLLNEEQKPEVFVHGTYHVELQRDCKIGEVNLRHEEQEIVHCVYAGTLDPRKGGAVAAAAAAEFLPENYHIHILGFGSDAEIQNMKDAIADIASRSKAKVSYDGLLSGEEYIRFIQSCDIGLSTQNPDAAFNATSFPSKILSYMANGLRVVSVRIPAIEQSAIGDKLYYYDLQSPEEIAKAILSVNFEDGYDSRRIIQELDDQFQKDMKSLLGV